MNDLSKNAKIVQDALGRYGLEDSVIELPDSTRTAEEAARAIGCQIGQIVKSLIFKTKRKEVPILALTSGANRVDERKIENQIGEPLGKANADFVRSATGFSIGGVPPIGLINKVPTYIDQDLMLYDVVWAAAGTPNAVFRINPTELKRITQAIVCDLKKEL